MTSPAHAASPSASETRQTTPIPATEQSTSASLSNQDAAKEDIEPQNAKISDENPPDSSPSNDPVSPFSDVVSIDTPAVLLTSIHSIDARVLALNTVNGGSFILDARDIQSPKVVELSAKTQVACTDQGEGKYFLALIERDTANAGFRLDVRTMSSPTDVANADLWKVKTRGFQPNPGSKCAFVEPRKLVVEGTRLRDGKVPYHGIFTVTPHKLELWPDFGIHVPHVVTAFNAPSSFEVLLRGVEVDENGKGTLQDKLYAVQRQDAEALTGTFRASADFLFYEGHQRYAFHAGDACLESPAGKVCPDSPDSLESVLWLAPAGADIRFGSGKHGYVRRLADYPALLELPKHEVVLAELGDGYYLLASQPDLRQDVGIQLRIGRK